MTTISEAEFARICDGINEDRESIIKHNPIGPPDEILLWMLLSCLISYLNLSESRHRALTTSRMSKPIVTRYILC